MKKFVIITIGRTGSTLLCELLDSHPDIVCKREIFNPTSLYFREWGAPSNYAWLKDPFDSLEAFWQRFSNETTICGFKILPYYLKSDFFHHILEDESIHKIVLDRRNAIRRYISSRNARRSSIYHIEQGYVREQLRNNAYVFFDALRLRDFSQAVRSVKFVSRLISHLPKSGKNYKAQPLKIAPADLIQSDSENREFYKHIRSVLNRTKQNHFTIYYEDFVDLRKEGVLRDLLDFLGASPLPLRSDRLHRLHDASLPELVANYAELRTALKGTELEAFLTENRQ